MRLLPAALPFPHTDKHSKDLRQLRLNEEKL